MQQRVKKGEVYWARTATCSGCGKGIEEKIRPVLIISNNTANFMSGVVSVIPLSSKIEKLQKGCHVLIQVLKPSILLPEQISTICKENLLGKITSLDSAQLELAEAALKKQLGLKAGWLKQKFLSLKIISYGRYCFYGAGSHILKYQPCQVKL